MDFCSTCVKLQISLSGFISHPGSDDNPRLKSPISSLGSLGTIRSNSQSCPLCRLVFAAFRSGPLKKISDVTNLGALEVLAVWINALGPEKNQRLKSPSLVILVWIEAPNIPLGTYKMIIRAVSRMLPEQPYFGRISDAQADSLDFGRIKGWLRHCDKQHMFCATSSSSSQPTRHFFLVDVSQKRIVRAPERCRYLTLSYVWGDSSQLQLSDDNFNIFTQKNSLEEKYLSPTIRDAMIVTSNLGENFIWIDALCIIQDSVAVRQQTILDMDRIYAGSLLTIVAGTCKSADDPLPGVTKPRVWKQWYQKISPNLTLMAQFDFKDFLENSTYSKRAWTYQEYQLSPRVLVFALNGQVYYSCKQAVFSEEVVSETSSEADVAMLEGAQVIKVDPRPDVLWKTYRRSVETYSRRSMKNESDILSAFSGILRMICLERSIEGLPVPIFDCALLWQPKERLRRRAGFCSWSWAGWVGRVHWFDTQFLDCPNERTQNDQDIIDSWLESRGWIVWYSSWGINTKSPAFLIDGPPLLRGVPPSASSHEDRFPGQKHNFVPTPSLLPRRLDRLEYQRRCIRYLQFWTISVYYHIEPDTSAIMRFSSLEPENTGSGLRLFLLRDQSAQECGWVLLDEDWLEAFSQSDIRLQEFILLSEGRKSEHKFEPRHDEVVTSANSEYDFCEFNAMMITWRDGVAERAGLGRVRKENLSGSCARPMKWKEIILG